MAAGLVQGGQEGQVVFEGGGVAAAAARSGEFGAGEQVSARNGRGRRFLFLGGAITMAETEPLMQAYSLLVKELCSGWPEQFDTRL